MGTIVDKANATEPRLNQAFLEYAQDRGFVVDPARVRSPKDKAWATDCTSWLDGHEDVVPRGDRDHRLRRTRTHPAACRRAA